MQHRTVVKSQAVGWNFSAYSSETDVPDKPDCGTTKEVVREANGWSVIPFTNERFRIGEKNHQDERSSQVF